MSFESLKMFVSLNMLDVIFRLIDLNYYVMPTSNIQHRMYFQGTRKSLDYFGFPRCRASKKQVEKYEFRGIVYFKMCLELFSLD